MKNIKIFVFVFILNLTLQILAYKETGYKEYNIKAAWLQKFARYIDWPPIKNIKDRSKPFIIGIVGKDPFGSILQVYKNRKIKKKMVVFKSFPLSIDIYEFSEIEECHMLFLARSVKPQLLKILSKIKNKPILTIGDTKGYGKKGVHINFKKKGERISIEINPIAIKESLLSIEPSLLSVGKIIKSKKRES